MLTEAVSCFFHLLRLLRRRVCQLETPGPSTRASASRRPLTAVVRSIEVGEVGLVSPRGGPACIPHARVWRRSASDDDASRCLLLALSHDELGVIFDGLADPLQPVVAFALSSTCLGLRTPLLTALEALWQRHARAKALGWKAGILKTGRHGSALNRVALSCADLRDAEELDWRDRGLPPTTWRRLG